MRRAFLSLLSLMIALAVVPGTFLFSTPTAHAATVTGAYVPLTPARLLDTRTGTTPAAGSVTNVTITGRAGVPGGATAVVLNVTAVGPSAPGFLTVFPKGSARPTASNLNFTALQTVPNQVVATVGSSGAVSIYASSRANIVVDVAGYFPTSASYRGLKSFRALDTRTTVRPGAASATTVPIAGRGGVPTNGVAAVVLNLAAVNPSSDGYLTAYPSGSARPTASNINYQPKENLAGLVVTPLGVGGSVDIYSLRASDLIVDVLGWIPSGTSYVPVPAHRALDTRSNVAVAAGTSVKVPVLGRAGVPMSGVTAVELDVTAVRPTRAGYLTTYPTGPRPTASNVNFVTSRTIANSVTAKVGSDGYVNVYASATTHVVVDVVGYTAKGGSAVWGAPQQILQNGAHLTGVSCTSAAFCAAVDQNGTLTAMTTTGGWQNAIVDPWVNWTGVSCANDATCVAVGTRPIAPSRTEAVATTYDASGWSRPTAVLPHGTLDAISCPTPTFCMAVGRDSSSRGVTVQFDGSIWSAPTTTGPAALTAVSCPTDAFCATGASDGAVSTGAPGSWTTKPVIGGAVLSVSCVSESFCMATGDREATFDGTTWTYLPWSKLFHSRASCATATRCTVVGDFGGTNLYLNGGFGSPSYLSGDDTDAEMTAVSCPTTDFCAIADNNRSGSVVWRWDQPTGTLGKVVITTGEGNLRSVSCPTATFCAVANSSGYVLTGTSTGTWSVPVNLGRDDLRLSCPSDTFCAAAGRTYASMLMFSGGSWAPMPATHLTKDVSCTSPSFCAAIGSAGVSRFDGTQWGVQTRLPNGQSGSKVSCVSPTYCVAVLVATNGASSSLTWNGTTWNGLSWSGPTPITTSTISALSCAAEAACIATDQEGNAYRLTSMGWSGPTAVSSAGLSGVACPSTTWCMAVDRTGGTFVWDGTTWSVRGVVPGDDTRLSAVSCPAVNHCTAVGPSALLRTFG
ncbi:hypothetical protein [Flexivirga alba]|uniref:Uncharacterized protein n=1 Tax=Flexivirga alba TaxID=702742 RepID=A0ABW2ALP5_9MICO